VRGAVVLAAGWGDGVTDRLFGRAAWSCAAKGWQFSWSGGGVLAARVVARVVCWAGPGVSGPGYTSGPVPAGTVPCSSQGGSRWAIRMVLGAGLHRRDRGRRMAGERLRRILDELSAGDDRAPPAARL